nr:MAG TPA: ECF RNA polymerase sigma factor-anti-sigma complex, zinc binding motif.8A [Caudoviricetes sp.]
MVEKQCQIDIATEIGYERSTIGRRLPRIMNRAIEIMERIS